MANPEHLEILKQGVRAWNAWRENNRKIDPDLSGAHLVSMDMVHANLVNANLRNANLVIAHLDHADLINADLSDADLMNVSLTNTNFTDTNLTNTNFTDTSIGGTIFGNVDLSVAKGLDSAWHIGPSSVGIDTIYKSHGNLPEKFLRGCGVPEDFITYMRSLTGKAIEFYSCFISYSSKDEGFAKRLHTDLQSEGVRCWFAPEDLKIGDKFRARIDESIRLYDKLLLVLSENSVSSEWVGDEVEAALEKEDEQKKIVLFPLNLDGAVMDIKTGWPAKVRRTRHIGDFFDWKNHDSYKRAFDRLMRDLKAEASR